MTTTPEATPATKPTRERRSWTVTLEDSTNARFEVRLEKRRDGQWRSYARHVVGTGKNRKVTRGATEMHAAEASARTAVAAVITHQERAGWRRRVSTRGFAAQPDAFTLANLPAPAKTKK